MSKQIRWQIPFVSRLGTAYRVDIYDEQDGSWSGVTQLLGGTSPFTTDEDSSDDYFAPIRVQTGTLTVCTHDEDGNVLITLDDILPASNISRPVRLVNVGTGAIEWQGFLSCEAYDQDYTDIPQHLQLPVISVLEAMASVQLDPTRSNGLTTVKSAIKTALSEMMTQSGMDFYTHVNYSGTSYQIFNKYIDQSVFFESKEYNNENSTTYIVSGLSVKNVLERLAQYMGWVVREQGTKIYFERMGDDIYTWEDTYAQFGGANPGVQIINFTTKALANDVDWVGVDHKRTVQQGAKSVEVVARLEKYELQLSIPEFPAGEVSTYYLEMNYDRSDSEFWSRKWWYMVASQNDTAYSSLKLGFRKLNKTSNGSYHCFDYGNSTIQDVLAHMLEAGDESTARQGIYPSYGDPYTYHAGAFFAKESFEDSEQQVHDTEEGLHCVFFPYTIKMTAGSQTPPDFDPAKSGYIAQMSSVVSFYANSGYLNLQCEYSMLYLHWASEGTHLAVDSGDATVVWRCGMRLKFGDKYWNGTSWQTTACIFEAPFKGGNFEGNWSESMGIPETEGLLIPIPSPMNGEVILEIWPNVSMLGNNFNWWVFESFFKKMSVDYIPPIDDTLTDRSENHYFRLLGTNFRDEISVGTELASMLNNQPSPSLIMDNSTTPMKTLDYLVSGGTEARRPEVDLLNRLATYYGAARQRLDLIVEHPTAAPLPLLRLNGISPDSRTYAPLAESRDWQQDSSTLKCFETPTEPQES